MPKLVFVTLPSFLTLFRPVARVFFLASILVALLCSISFAATPKMVELPDEIVQKLPPSLIETSHLFRKTMVTCPEKIWPNFSWQNLQVIFVHPSLGFAMLWEGQSTKLYLLDMNDLPESVVGRSFDFFEFNGKATMSLNIEIEDEKNLFSLGVHEFFHDQGQNPDEWAINTLNLRGTKYPMTATPRIYRRYLFDNLKSALGVETEKERSAFLSQARYWFDIWKTEFPHEFAMATDRIEGVADYVEKFAVVLSTNACNATDDILLSKAKSFFARVSSLDGYSLDQEGYEIGSLATLLLRLDSKNFNHAVTKIKKGRSPVEVLLSQYPSIAQSSSKDIQKHFENFTKKKNKEIGTLVDSDLRNFSNSEYLRIEINQYWLQSVLIPVNFVVSDLAKDFTIIPLGKAHSFKSPNGSSSLTAQEKSVLFVSDNYNSNPCSSQIFTLVKKSEVKTSGSESIHISSRKVQASLKGRFKKDASGFEYFCLDE